MNPISISIFLLVTLRLHQNFAAKNIPIDENIPNGNIPSDSNTPNDNIPSSNTSSDSNIPNGNTPSDSSIPNGTIPSNSNIPNSNTPSDSNIPNDNIPNGNIPSDSKIPNGNTSSDSNISNGNIPNENAPTNGSALEPNNIITTACKVTRFIDLCITSLTSFPETTNANLYDLSILALNLTLSKAMDNARDVSRYLKTIVGDSYTLDCLGDCSDQYRDAVKGLQDSFKALVAGAFTDAITWTSSAMTYVSSCEEGFADEPGHLSPLADANELFDRLCSNALAIMNLAAKG